MLTPPPIKWRQFFVEALRTVAVLTTFVRRGISIEEIKTRTTTESKIFRPACCSNRIHTKGTENQDDIFAKKGGYLN